LSVENEIAEHVLLDVDRNSASSLGESVDHVAKFSFLKALEAKDDTLNGAHWQRWPKKRCGEAREHVALASRKSEGETPKVV
jgi:hypothetical protein